MVETTSQDPDQEEMRQSTFVEEKELVVQVLAEEKGVTVLTEVESIVVAEEGPVKEEEEGEVDSNKPKKKKKKKKVQKTKTIQKKKRASKAK